MKTIKFAGLGWDGYTGQISRMRDGVKELGHSLDLEILIYDIVMILLNIVMRSNLRENFQSLF